MPKQQKKREINKRKKIIFHCKLQSVFVRSTVSKFKSNFN